MRRAECVCAVAGDCPRQHLAGAHPMATRADPGESLSRVDAAPSWGGALSESNGQVGRRPCLS